MAVLHHMKPIRKEESPALDKLNGRWF